jgi:pimeloyl-ACP methyl ester carboxylesterase
MPQKIEFPLGYRAFHADANFNFQLNRWLPYWDEQEVHQAAKQISNVSSWKSTMLSFAANAEKEGRCLNAAFFFRAAEFFMSSDDPDKMFAYEKFLTLYHHEFPNVKAHHVDVPFGQGSLPAYVFKTTTQKRDTLLIHGGFDSFKEEFIEMVEYFTEQGFDIILFEGPGQGSPLLRQHMPMAPEWNEPVSALIDHFDLAECSLLGISLGGYLAPRAAAYDKRIKRVIAFDVLDDFFDVLACKLPAASRGLLKLLLACNAKPIINTLLENVMRKDEFVNWGMNHGMHVSGTSNPYDYLLWSKKMSTTSFSHLIEQDFLLMGGDQDHLIPLHQFYRQIKSLTNTRSLTTRLFTDRENCSAHCQVGNMQLATEFIVNWLLFQLDHKDQQAT